MLVRVRSKILCQPFMRWGRSLCQTAKVPVSMSPYSTSTCHRAESTENVTQSQLHGDRSWIGIGAALQRIVVQVRLGRRPLQNPMLENDSFLKSMKQLTLSQWMTYANENSPKLFSEDLFPIEGHARFVNRIIANLNAKRNMLHGISSKQHKLSAEDLVCILRNLDNKSSAFELYRWARMQSSHVADPSVFAAVIDCLTDCPHSVLAWFCLEEVMEHMVQRKMFLDNRLLTKVLQWSRGYVSHSDSVAHVHVNGCLRWFLEMKDAGLEPHYHTYKMLMKMCNRVGLNESTLLLMKDIPKNNDHLWAYAIALSACRDMKDLKQAEAFWKEMRRLGLQPDVKCYTSVLSLYASLADADMAIALYRDMQDEGITPDMFVYDILLRLYGSLCQVKEAEEIFKCAFESGAALHPEMYGAMSDCYIQAGLYNELIVFFDTYKVRIKPWCYFSAIQVCATEGHWEVVVHVLKQMRACNIEPRLSVVHTIVHEFPATKEGHNLLETILPLLHCRAR